MYKQAMAFIGGVTVLVLIISLCASYILSPVQHCTISHNVSLGIVSTTNAYAIPFNTNDNISGVIHTLNDTIIKIPCSGTYSVTISAMVKNSSNANDTLDVWIEKTSNGGGNWSTYPNSNTIVSVDKDVTTLANSMLIDFVANDSMKVMYCASNVGVSMPAFPTKSNPTRPMGESVTVSIYKIGR